MIVVMRVGASQEEIDTVVERIESIGYQPHLSPGAERVVIGVVGTGQDRPADPEDFRSMRGVDSVVPIGAPYKLASRNFSAEDSVFTVRDTPIGGPGIALMAGPCSVEDREGTLEIAGELAGMGVTILRGGAFKPRTSPYSFQGLGEEALKILAEARDATGMAIITEVMGSDEVEMVSDYVDILQLGTRNMQNYRLLEAVGRQPKPVLLKRGMSATIEELLLAAEYILSQGNAQVLLCERGIRTYETATRSTFDVNAVPVLKGLSHLPVIVDPSHATGRADLIAPISRAAIAAGADGLIIEVHSSPEDAVSDGAQSLRPAAFAELLDGVERIAQAVDRTLIRTPTTAP
ncbi:MAG: aroF [Thermoleophilia bacterium]|nr:aroF [Thermoleophilia bacterium]